MNEFGWYLPPGVTSRMIDDLYKTAICKLCGQDLDRYGDCVNCEWEEL